MQTATANRVTSSRTFVFAALVAVSGISLVLIGVFASALGLGTSENFFLFRFFAVTRHEAAMGGSLLVASSAAVVARRTCFHAAALILRSLIADRSPWFIAAGVAIISLLPRLAWIAWYDVPMLSPDSFAILDIAHQLLEGRPPNLIQRPILYPALIAAFLDLGGGVRAVIGLQMGLSVLSNALLAYAVTRRFPHAGLAVLVALGAIGISGLGISLDAALLSESLFTTLLKLTFAVLFALPSRHGLSLLVAPAALACVVTQMRPIGIVIFPLVAVWALVVAPWRQGRIAGLAAVVGAALSYTGPLLYNAANVGLPIYNFAGAASLMNATIYYWEPVESLPEAVNAKIREARERLTPEDRRLLDQSWNLAALADIYIRYNDWPWINKTFWPMAGRGELSPSSVRGGPLGAIYDLYRRVSSHAVAAHPLLFLKLAVANFVQFVWDNLEPGGTLANWANDHRQITLHSQLADYPEATEVVRIAQAEIRDQKPSIANITGAVLVKLERVSRFKMIGPLAGFVLCWAASRCISRRAILVPEAMLILIVGWAAACDFVIAAMQPADPRYGYPVEVLLYLGAISGPVILLSRNRSLP